MSAAIGVLPLPPSYDVVPPPDLSDLSSLISSDLQLSDLPSYSRSPAQAPVASSGPARSTGRSPPQEFHYELNKKGKTFAILTIIADGQISRQMPIFIEGQPVKGRVQLMLDKPDAIQSVTINVLGQFITGANQGEQLSFIDISHTLWTQTDGEPRNVNSGDGDSSPTTPNPPTKYSGKLVGNYTWSFSIDLPKQVVVPYGKQNEPQIFTPPQTFNERHTRASINYEVSLRLGRNKLRVDHRIPAAFGYIPITRPPPMPPLRLQAYAQGTSLLGPTIDPDGWHSTDAVSIKGRAFNSRAFNIQCKLFLAKPLAYTRGSVIPLCLRLESPDAQVLDMLSNPKAIVTRMRRRIKYHYNAEKTVESFAWRDAIDHSQLALWWPSAEGSEDRHGRVRYVNGELHLRSDIKPTSAMSSFRVEYSIVLFQFDAVGVDCSESPEDLIEQPVDIVTAYAPGARPRMLAPPGYEADIAVQQVTQVVSVERMGFF
ncbi:hypothetical protein D9619_004143 [Psilocybe cf. subviscida]|uniref:Arrestin-like N-terminal domain-containing protein n=1 Tax=Psilocybe cf. subviscida TaxID=2480587 RepID=A0A8H5BNX4_9AGAR|nr:hypothetical protein D9619_004143 [Psilocybe cf. subviscida]